MSPRARIVAALSGVLIGLIALLVTMSAARCRGAAHSGGSAERSQTEAAKVAQRLDAARLRELELTYEVPRQVRQACAEARRLASVRVVCPRLVPDVPLTNIAGLWGSIVLDAEPRFYMLSFNNGGLPGGKRHWLTGGGLARVIDKWVLTDFANEVKGDPKLVRTLNVRGRRVLVYRFPPFPAGGPNGGHWAAFVRSDDEVVFASLHGKRYLDAAVEMALDLAQQAERLRP
jgi:hypothetical protein